MSKLTGKKKDILILSILLITSVIIGSTLAIWTISMSQEGHISTGKVNGEILIDNGNLENLFPGAETKYKVDVKNTGTKDMLVRVKVTSSFMDRPDLETDVITINYFENKWLKGGDGYYYYKGILSPSQISEEALVKSFTLKNTIKNDYKGANAQITVNLECVQAAGNAINIWNKTYEELEIVPPGSAINGEELSVTLVDSSTNFTITGDIFLALENLVPGETVTSKIKVNNTGRGIVDIFFKAEGLEDTPQGTALLEKVNLVLTDSKGNNYYTGTLAGNEGTGNINIGSYERNDEKEFNVSITLDPLADNAFQENLSNMKLTFTATENTGGVNLTVTPVDMVDYIQGKSLTNDTFPHVVIGKMVNFVGGDNKDTIFNINGSPMTIEDYIISQYAFYRVLPGGGVSPVPTEGTLADPETSGTYIIKAKPEANLTIDRYQLMLGEAVLTCRPSNNHDTSVLVTNTLPTTSVTKPIATIPPGTILTNSAGVVVTNISGVALLRSDLLNDHTENYNSLISSIENIILTRYGYRNYLPLRMALVDTNNGNIYLVTDEENYVTLTLPYPEGTSKDTHDFIILHYEEGDDLRDPFDYIVDVPVEIVPEKTEEGLRLGVNNFSPFAIGWKEMEKPVPEPPNQSPNPNLNPFQPSNNGKGPKTGNINNLFMWGKIIIIGTLGFGGMIYIIKRSKRKHEK